MLRLVVVYLEHAHFTDGDCLDRQASRDSLKQPIYDALPTVIVVDLEGSTQLRLRLLLH